MGHLPNRGVYGDATSSRLVAPSLNVVALGAVICAVAIAGLFFPAVPLLVASLAVAASAAKVRIAGYMTAATLTILLAWINAGKSIQGDWVWYTQLYSNLRFWSFPDYLGTTFGPTAISLKLSEPLYYAFASALAKLTDANIAALAVAITVLCYGLISFSVVELVARGTESSRVMVTSVVLAILCGVTFTLTTQLIRQELAGVLALAGFTMLTSRWKLFLASRWQMRIAGSVLLVGAVLTHNSVAVPIGAVVAAMVLSRANALALPGLVVASSGFFVLGLFLARAQGNAAYLTAESGHVAPSVLILDAALVAGFAVVSWPRMTRQPPGAPQITSRFRFVFIAAALFVGMFLVGIRDLPIPFFRMYLYIEMFRTVAIAYIACHLLSRSKWPAFAMPYLILGAFVYLGLRIAQSPFTFEYGGLLGHLGASPF